jgi:hypothetical protein
MQYHTAVASLHQDRMRKLLLFGAAEPRSRRGRFALPRLTPSFASMRIRRAALLSITTTLVKNWGLEMTIQIKGVQIARISALTIRNMLRGVNELVCADYVAQRCKVPLQRAKQIVETLVSEGYLEFDKRYKELANPYVTGKEKRRYRHVPYYKLTAKGEKLAQASALSKMPRGRAEPILAGLLRRVEEVNATPHYLFRIPTVIVYGSYVRGEALLGDVDIAVDLEPKWERASKEFEVQSKKRVNVAQAKEGGSQISSSICTGRSARSCSI